MQNKIFIEEEKEFTIDEFSHLVARAIRSLSAANIGADEVVYSRDDVYFTIVDVLGYINERTPGNFKFSQTSFQDYQIHYIPPYAEKKKKDKGLKVGLAQSAITIKESTGKYPVWATRDDTVMEIIKGIEKKNESASPNVTTKSSIEKRARVAIKYFQNDGVLPLWVDSDPALKARVTELLPDDNEGGIPWLAK